MTKYLLYNSRLVKPEMEKPKRRNDYLDHYFEYLNAMSEYRKHLSTLPGIECSAELLAKFKNGDELIEGKDFEMEQTFKGYKEVRPNNYEPIVIILAVPVKSDEEGEINLHDFLEEYGNYVLIHDGWNAPADFLKDFPNYKLTKR